MPVPLEPWTRWTLTCQCCPRHPHIMSSTCYVVAGCPTCHWTCWSMTCQCTLKRCTHLPPHTTPPPMKTRLTPPSLLLHLLMLELRQSSGTCSTYCGILHQSHECAEMLLLEAAVQATLQIWYNAHAEVLVATVMHIMRHSPTSCTCASMQCLCHGLR